jgi:large-conductance mechanosensitive channel
MISRRSEALTPFLNAFKTLVFEGSLWDWGIVMIALSIPPIFADIFSNLFSSLVSDILTPIVFAPLLSVLAFDSLERLATGSVRIGAFVG